MRQKSFDKILSVVVFIVAILISFIIVRLEMGAYRRPQYAEYEKKIEALRGQIKEMEIRYRQVSENMMERWMTCIESNKVLEARIKKLQSPK